jgi:transcription-repair coupling factor (superfamily II helicase)
MKQGKMIGYFISTIRLLSIQTFSSSLAVCAKKQFYLQNERKTNSGWFAIAIDFDNVKNTRTALEFMELLGE